MKLDGSMLVNAAVIVAVITVIGQIVGRLLDHWLGSKDKEMHFGWFNVETGEFRSPSVPLGRKIRRSVRFVVIGVFKTVVVLLLMGVLYVAYVFLRWQLGGFPCFFLSTF